MYETSFSRWDRPPQETIVAPTDEQLIAALIRVRIGHVQPEMHHHVRPPIPEETPVVSAILNTDSLWIHLGEVRFIARPFVEACIYNIHELGSQRNDSVFYAMRQDSIARRWGIRPLSVTRKQRNQYWDERFVSVLFASIQIDPVHTNRLFHKIAYRIHEDISVKKLLQLKTEQEKQLASNIKKLQYSDYISVRRQWPAYFSL